MVVRKLRRHDPFDDDRLGFPNKEKEKQKRENGSHLIQEQRRTEHLTGR